MYSEITLNSVELRNGPRVKLCLRKFINLT